MGSTICVRCGANLIPHSYCDACQEVLSFVCSSCSKFTDERVHAYCRNVDSVNKSEGIYFQEIQNPSKMLKPSFLIMNNEYASTHYYIQNQLNDEIKHTAINLLTSYWFNIFESIKMINRYWSRLFSIGNKDSSIA